MAERSHARASLDRPRAAIFDRENVDQVSKSETVLDAADIDIDFAAADV
ncbi:hypothetical protein FHX08_001178 [Rhizobium sp. BK529]|nr:MULTISPECIES: hypothetical protein [unclassified Rhizobium]MBB3590834.1 hypothetical protein [Rhizobium sp. BK529]